MTPHTHNSASGFTLIELMVTLAVAAIILTVGVPSFVSMTRDNSLITQTNELVADINLARSEAVKRGTRVVLCRSANPAAATPTCGGNANTWTTGWLMFADTNRTGTYVAADDTLIRIGQPTGGTLTVITNNVANNNLEYNADGTTNEGGGTALFVICDDRGASKGRQIQVNAMGRPRLIKGSEAALNCTAPAQV